MKGFATYGAVAVLGALAVWALLRPSPVVIRVLPHFAIAPAGVRLTITVERQAANRWLTVEVDGDHYFASSSEQLEGEAAPRIRQRIYDRLPEGQYEARAILVRADDTRRVAREAFCFSGPRTACTEARRGQR